ncbi:MAG: PKD domain-containing protein, partial [Sphingobacteriales bacterium]
LDVINLDLRGGSGDYNTSNTFLHGPGGGGGGGVLWISQPTIPLSFNFDLNGGSNGVNINLGNNAAGATPGQAGLVHTAFTMPYTTIPADPNILDLDISTTALSCTAFDFKGAAVIKTAPITNWVWHWGDGNTSAGQNATHTYTATGDHTVKLVITDGTGCSDSTSAVVTPLALDFDFTYRQDICEPLTVQFSGTGAANNPYWNFGAGSTSSGQVNANHTFAATGDYPVRYSVSLNSACTDTLEKLIKIDIQQQDIILTKDTTICYGTVKQLRSAPLLGFCWFPTDYLDNPLSPSPVTSSPNDITYYLTAEINGANLIVNGDFSQGNTGFFSDYFSSVINTTEGQYHVGVNPRNWNGGMSDCTDHTSGTGNMMMVNGAPTADAIVWRQTVSVQPNTNYAFSTWIESLVTQNPAQLQFSINGKALGTPIAASAQSCNWNMFYTTWNSGSSTTAEIAIINKNTLLPGNDFALDDISFAEVFVKKDSVKITVEKPLVTANADTVICSGKPVQLVAAGAQDYTWMPNLAITDVSVSNPVASPVATTQYIVTGTTANGCVAKDTVLLNVFAKPVISLQADTAICKS